MFVQIRLRRDTIANWCANSSVILASGEVGLITDDNSRMLGFVVGDGVSSFNALTKYSVLRAFGSNYNAQPVSDSLSQFAANYKTSTESATATGTIPSASYNSGYIGFITNMGGSGGSGTSGGGGKNFFSALYLVTPSVYEANSNLSEYNTDMGCIASITYNPAANVFIIGGSCSVAARSIYATNATLSNLTASIARVTGTFKLNAGSIGDYVISTNASGYVYSGSATYKALYKS